ncbi:hypothetical protein T492DRAFT_1145562 [Pavlovales sp. CCMP2436]|nr:hypothetical protein T492DRAFT_1145562 [Pavlovales sp. CCMP2436]
MQWLLALAVALSLACASEAFRQPPVGAARRPRAVAATSVHSSRLLRRVGAIHTAARACEEDEEEDEDSDDLEIMIWIEDPVRKTSIRCYMESSTEFEGSRYALAHPVDIPVIIATCEDEEEGLHALVDEAQIDAVFDIAKEVLTEEGFDLKRTPFMLTVEEDEDAFDQDQMDDDDVAAFYDEDDEPDVDEIEEGAEVLAKFFHAGQQYYIAEPLEPTFIIARQTSGTRFTLLSDADMERVKPVLERNFIELNQAFADEDDDEELDDE